MDIQFPGRQEQAIDFGELSFSASFLFKDGIRQLSAAMRLICGNLKESHVSEVLKFLDRTTTELAFHLPNSGERRILQHKIANVMQVAIEIMKEQSWNTQNKDVFENIVIRCKEYRKGFYD